jgi:hypothetical protein
MRWTTGAHTNDDVVEGLVGDLVNCSKHDKNTGNLKDGIKETTNGQLFTTRLGGAGTQRSEIRKPHFHAGNKIEPLM